MASQMTEMLKGTLEGLVLAFLSGRSAYGYEITAWLRDQGLLRIREMDDGAIWVATATEDGVDIARGRPHPGVARPAPR